MENSAANQLPEADSLPDGFVDSVSEPLTPSPAIPPSPATPDQEDQVTDYKEERLVEVDSRPDLVVDDFQSCEGDDGSAEQAHTFPVELSEYVSNDTQKLVKPSLENHIAESDDGSPSFVSENIVRKTEPELTPLSDGNGNAGETCQSSKKATEQGVETQAANVQGTLSSESSVTSRKVTSEVKRKSIKRTFKTEKEFLEFTLSYQKVLSERDAAITMRDKLESLCRELQRQNMMLMDECKRVSTESQNLRLELLCHIEPQVPYLLYRNASQEVNGIWFYNTRECEDVANLFTRILGAYSKVSPKQKVNKSEFEELEAVPTSAVIEGPLEPGFDKRVLGKLDHV